MLKDPSTSLFQSSAGAQAVAADARVIIEQWEREREREIHYIFSSHLRADQMCRGSFLGIHQ